MKYNQPRIKPGVIVIFINGFDDWEYRVVSIMEDIEGLAVELDSFPCNIFACLDDVELVPDIIKPSVKKEKLSMKPFDLENALRGSVVVTRGGIVAQGLTYHRQAKMPYTITAIIDGNINVFTQDGLWRKGENNHLDLFMGTVKKQGWVNVYRGAYDHDDCDNREIGNTAHPTEEEAKRHRNPCRYITTIMIEWEE